MVGSLIHAYLNGEDNLRTIQALSLWANREIKKALLFVNSTTELYAFVTKVVDFNKPRRNRNRVGENRTTLTFTRTFPFGSPFQISFALVNQLCTLFGR